MSLWVNNQWSEVFITVVKNNDKCWFIKFVVKEKVEKNVKSFLQQKNLTSNIYGKSLIGGKLQKCQASQDEV